MEQTTFDTHSYDIYYGALTPPWWNNSMSVCRDDVIPTSSTTGKKPR